MRPRILLEIAVPQCRDRRHRSLMRSDPGRIFSRGNQTTQATRFVSRLLGGELDAVSADRHAMISTALAVLQEVDRAPLVGALQPNPGLSLSQRKASRTEGSIASTVRLVIFSRIPALPFGQKRVNWERRLLPSALSSKGTARRGKQVAAYPGVEPAKAALSGRAANPFIYHSLAWIFVGGSGARGVITMSS